MLYTYIRFYSLKINTLTHYLQIFRLSIALSTKRLNEILRIDLA